MSTALLYLNSASQLPARFSHFLSVRVFLLEIDLLNPFARLLGDLFLVIIPVELEYLAVGQLGLLGPAVREQYLALQEIGIIYQVLGLAGADNLPQVEKGLFQLALAVHLLCQRVAAAPPVPARLLQVRIVRIQSHELVEIKEGVEIIFQF